MVISIEELVVCDFSIAGKELQSGKQLIPDKKDIQTRLNSAKAGKSELGSAILDMAVVFKIDKGWEQIFVRRDVLRGRAVKKHWMGWSFPQQRLTGFILGRERIFLAS